MLQIQGSHIGELYSQGRIPPRRRYRIIGDADPMRPGSNLINITNREFVRLVRQAYQEMPEELLRSLDNVDVVVEEWPGPEEEGLVGGEDSLFGLYSGVPMTEREGGDPLLPDRIVIYRQPILRSCTSRTQAEREIKVTLWHEIGHYLGMSEDDLHRLGYG